MRFHRSSEEILGRSLRSILRVPPEYDALEKVGRRPLKVVLEEVS